MAPSGAFCLGGSMPKILVGEQYRSGLLYVVFNGIAYRQTGWFGCQLESIERTKPEVGSRRVFTTEKGCYTFEIQSVKWCGLFKYRCNWALPMNCDYTEYNKRIYETLDDILNWR